MNNRRMNLTVYPNGAEPRDFDEPNLENHPSAAQTEEQPEGTSRVDIADEVMVHVRGATGKAVEQANAVMAAAMNLRDQLVAHDQLTEGELRDRDRHAAETIKNHGEFVASSMIEFEKALEALRVIADNHLIEDGKNVPTRSDT